MSTFWGNQRGSSSMLNMSAALSDRSKCSCSLTRKTFMALLYPIMRYKNRNGLLSVYGRVDIHGEHQRASDDYLLLCFTCHVRVYIPNAHQIHTHTNTGLSVKLGNIVWNSRVILAEPFFLTCAVFATAVWPPSYSPQPLSCSQGFFQPSLL